MPEQNQYHSDIVWNIANLLRDPYRPPQYRKVMIPLTVLRRLDCVLEQNQADIIREHARLSANDLSSEVIEAASSTFTTQASLSKSMTRLAVPAASYRNRKTPSKEKTPRHTWNYSGKSTTPKPSPFAAPT